MGLEVILPGAQNISAIEFLSIPKPYLRYLQNSNRNQTLKKYLLQRLLKHQDIQGDIRHPVDYLVDLIETKVRFVLVGLV